MHGRVAQRGAQSRERHGESERENSRAVDGCGRRMRATILVSARALRREGWVR